MRKNEFENEFICAACGERHSGHPLKVRIDINIEKCSGSFLAHNQSLFSSASTYESYCQRCAYGIAAYLAKRMGLGRLNKGSLTDKIAKVRAERSMADIGRKLWNGIGVNDDEQKEAQVQAEEEDSLADRQKRNADSC